MSMATEAVYEDQTYFEEYEEVEEAVLEDLLQEAETAALEQELSEQDPGPLEEDSSGEESDHASSEEGETSSHEDSSLLESAETDEDVEDINGANEVEWENPEVIEIVEEEVLEESSGIENVTEEEVGEEEYDSIVITPEELQLNDEAQELSEEDQIESFLEENEVLDLEGIEEVSEITELDQHDDHVELDDIEEVVHQEEPEEIPDVEEVEQHDDLLELKEKISTIDELYNVEETEELQTTDQEDVVDLQDQQEEEGYEEDLIDNIEENLDEKLEEHTESDNLEEQTEEFADPAVETEELLEDTNPDYVIEEQQSAIVKEVSVPADIETLEKEFCQVPEEYQSVFTPQEQVLAHFMADLLLFETIQARQESHTSATTVSEKQELLTPSPYTVSFNEEFLPPVSLDHYGEEISSLEEELAQLESPRAFQHFHEQLQESQLQILTIDSQLSLESLADDLKLVSQRDPLPEPPPYDFLAELESYEEDEAQLFLQQLKNPLYPYRPRRNRLQTLNRVRPEIVQAKASTHSTQHDVPKIEAQDPESKDPSGEALPVERNKPGLEPSRKIPLSKSVKLKVLLDRRVVKQQIEALDKLKSLDHEIDPTDDSTRIITLTATSQKEMGEVLFDKMGDFTYEPYVIKHEKRSLVKLKRGSWKPMANFIEYGTVEKEIFNINLDQTDWVTYSKPNSWEYTGNQRIITKVRMDLLKQYYTKLEELARTLARDTWQMRGYLSKHKKNSVVYKDLLNFWVRYGYQLPKMKSETEKTSIGQLEVQSKENVKKHEVSRIDKNSAINNFISTFNTNMQNLMNTGESVPLEVYESLETIKRQFPNFIPVFRYEGPYFFMENYNDLIYDIKPWELITSSKGGSYTTVFHAIRAIRERTYVLKNPYNNRTYRTMKDNVPRVTNKRGFHQMFRKLKDESIRHQLMKYNKFSPQQANKTIWEEKHSLKDVENILRAYLNELRRNNRISPYLKAHIKKEINHRLEGFTSITNYPSSSTYIIKAFDTEDLVSHLMTNNKGMANLTLKNSAKMNEFITIIDKFSSEIGNINLSEIIGARFDNDRVISVASPDDFISNGKVLKAYFESCSEAHINAIPRFIFQSQKWVRLVGLSPNHQYTAYNTGNAPNLDQDEVAASGRQDFTIVDEDNQTHAIAQNKLLRTEVSSGRSSYLAEVSRDLVATQGFGVPGYNIFTLINQDARTTGIEPSISGANITYIGVSGGLKNPSLGFPKLGQAAEWAMYKANDSKNQVTSGSHLVKEVNLNSLLKEVTTNQYRSSQKTTIPTNSRLKKNLVKKIHSSINSTKEPLKFLLEVLRLSTTLKNHEQY